MITKKQKKHTFFSRCILIFFLVVLFFSLSLFYYFLNLEKKFTNKIYPHVFIDNFDVGGKNVADFSVLENKKNQSLANLTISIFYKNEVIASFSAQTLDLKYNYKETADRAYLIGRVPLFIPRLYQKLSTLTGLAKYRFYSEINYDKSALNEFIMSAEEQYNKPAKNALFKFENSRVASFRKEEKGLKILTIKLLDDIDKQISLLKNNPENKNVVLEDEVIEPEITLAEANEFGIEELIGEGKSDYSHSIPERIHNLTLATSKFNGVLIPKGKIFSFNDTIGDISSLTGYKPAYIIKNGRTVLGDGGGVCQVSTTLFRAALNTGLPIIERHAHAYRVGYYENDSKPGFDATVFSPTDDLKIKNDTSAYILIQTEIVSNQNLLYFRLYGKRDDRKIEISPVTIFGIQPPPPPLYQDDPTLKKGVVKQIDYAAWGTKTSFDYRVYKNNKIIFEQNFFSAYRPWQAIFLRGIAD